MILNHPTIPLSLSVLKPLSIICASALLPLSLLQGELCAQEATPEAKESTPDYSAALERLSGLLPFRAQSGDLYAADQSAGYWQVYSEGPSGGAWKLKTESGDLINVTSIDLKLSSAAGRKLAIESYPKQIIQKFGKQYLDDDNEWEWMSHGVIIAGKELINAAICYQIGEKAVANQMVHLVLSGSREPEQAIDVAISIIAEREMAGLYAKFETSRDWQVLIDGLTELEAKYGRGWVGRGGVKILRRQAEKIVAGETEPKPVLDGVAFTPGDHDRIAELLALPVEELGPKCLLEANPKRGPKISFRDFEILVGLLESDLLLLREEKAKSDQLRVPQFNSGNEVLGLVARRGISEEERAVSYYEKMERPKSVGELVNPILQGLLSDRRSGGMTTTHTYYSGSSREIDPFPGEMKDLWGRLKGLSAVKQAQVLLGRGEARGEALDYLLANGSKAEVAALREQFLADPIGNVAAVVELIKKEGKKGADLFAALDRAASGYYQLGENEFYQEVARNDHQGLLEYFRTYKGGELKKRIGALKLMVEDVSFEKMLDLLAEGKVTPEAMGSRLKAELEEKPLGELLPSYLKRAMRIRDLDARAGMLSALVSCCSGQGEVDLRNTVFQKFNQHPKLVLGGMGTREPMLEAIGEEKKHWLVLLDDKREFTDESTYQELGIHTIASRAMAMIYGKANYADLLYLSYLYDSRDYGELVVKACRNFAETGKNLQLPVPGTIDEAQVSAWRGEYLAQSVESRGAWFEKAEVNAQIELIARRAKDKELDAAFNELSDRVCQVDEGAAKKWPELSKMLGKEVTPEWFQAFYTAFYAQMAKDSDTGSLMLNFSPLINGWTLIPIPEEASEYMDQMVEATLQQSGIVPPEGRSYLLIMAQPKPVMIHYEGIEQTEKQKASVATVNAALGAMIEGGKSEDETFNGGFILVPRPFLDEEDKAKDKLKNGLRALKDLIE